ncbi:MAG: uracil-DNA glycosylase [bacterium]
MPSSRLPEDFHLQTGFRQQEHPELFDVEARVVGCERCPRLRAHCRRVAREKKRAHRDQTYWGRPVPAFGDPRARFLIMGLAPAAHGANRTGRMFTSDSSGDWLFRALHETGFASQPDSVAPGDGMELEDAFITAPVRCAPPSNKPTAGERANCMPYLIEELDLLGERPEVVLVLGRIAFVQYFRTLEEMGVDTPTPRPDFRHGARCPVGPGDRQLLVSYHPSRQNTNTGVLTREMWTEAFREARRIVGD